MAAPIRPSRARGAARRLRVGRRRPEIGRSLEPGDVLVFYTDGVTDAVGPSGERFGDERLLATLAAARGGSAHDVVAAIRDAVVAFQADAEPADDVTIVAVGRRRGPSRASGGPSRRRCCSLKSNRKRSLRG